LLRKVVITLAVTLAAESAFAQASPSTVFIDLHHSLSGFGAYYYEGFTVHESTTFDVRFTSTYTADAAIVPASELSNFTSGRGYRGYSIFDGVIGTNLSVTVGPGTYYAVMRNGVTEANSVSFEIDYSLWLTDASFYDWYFGDNAIVQPNGGKAWQSFRIQEGVRYFLDGCNSGVESYVIPVAELSNFLGDRGFRYYTDYSSTSTAHPGFWELELPPGDYALVFRNSESIAQSATWQAERWIPNSRVTREPLSSSAHTGKWVPVRTGSATSALRAASVDASGAIRLTFSSGLEQARLRADQFQITSGEKTVTPAKMTYDEATGVLTLIPPDAGQASGYLTVSWRGLSTAQGMLSGGTDQLPAATGTRQKATRREPVLRVR
jgi:hypothetical protein